MATPLSLKTEIRDGTVRTLIAAGEIDLSNIEAFDHALGDVVARDGAVAIVDLSGVESWTAAPSTRCSPPTPKAST